MTDFIESRLLEDVANGFEGGPSWFTQQVQLQSGVVRRNALRSRPLHRYSASYQNISPDNMRLLRNAFNACQGAARGFRFKDWADYAVTAEPLGNTPGANSDPVQLIQTYTFGGQSITRNIVKPVSGSVTVYQDGIAKAGTLDTATGLFTPSTAWTAALPLTWTGEFDVPVRFVSDDFRAQFNTLNALSADIELEEVFF